MATYYRLSFADEDVGTDKAESNSIQGQRGLVEGYIMARPELAAEPRQEYVDDGYSGTSTSRPAFQQLIQDAQDGKIKTIIVKDFSRFARDYIEAGDYMERIFPLLGVRFISVNDEYDSGMQAGNDVRGLEVAIKNIINACTGNPARTGTQSVDLLFRTGTAGRKAECRKGRDRKTAHCTV